MPTTTLDSTRRLLRLEQMVLRLERRTDQLQRLSRKYWTVRRVIFFGGALLALCLCKLSGGAVGLVLAGVFLTAFCVVAFYHQRVLNGLVRNSVLLNLKQTQMARIRIDWELLRQTSPLSEPLPSQPPHPFETDLDITGERSLHRLLDIAVTKEGSQRLASWLLNTTPDSQTIHRRQALVQELQGHSLFRDKLQLYSAIASRDSKDQAPNALQQQWRSSIVIDWLANPVRQESLLPTVYLLSILAGLNIALFALAAFDLLPHVWPITFVIYVGLMILRQARIATAWGELQELEKALRRFRNVFQYLETRRYRHSPGLAKICAPFLDARNRPSAELRRLERLAAALGLRTNAILWLVVNAVVPWDFFFTYRLEVIKKELAHLLPQWLDAWYEIEALNSLANFAYLNPGYVFPEITCGSMRLSASALGHPLIETADKVCNDFELQQDPRIAILTGSNMAGKSTFLRTLGVNLCLTYAGAPVNAEHLQVSLFRIFTCIKVSDSVQDGLSYFYAEVKRLKALLSATEQDRHLPLFFLVDEIFRGTNSRERHIGGRAFIRELARRETVGLVATHDLELVKLADEIPGVANFHFREEVRAGKMVFDYRLRRGPCPTTNALRIMELEGLPVDNQ
jgi:hypothetical protein